MPPRDASRSSSKISRGRRNGKYCPLAQPVREVEIDLRVRPRVAGRVDGLADVDDAALDVAATPSSSSCRLPARTTSAWCAVSDRKKSIDAEELQFFERLAGEVRVGQRHQRIEADREQRL